MKSLGKRLEPQRREEREGNAMEFSCLTDVLCDDLGVLAVQSSSLSSILTARRSLPEADPTPPGRPRDARDPFRLPV